MGIFSKTYAFYGINVDGEYLTSLHGQDILWGLAPAEVKESFTSRDDLFDEDFVLDQDSFSDWVNVKYPLLTANVFVDKNNKRIYFISILSSLKVKPLFKDFDFSLGQNYAINDESISQLIDASEFLHGIGTAHWEIFTPSKFDTPWK